MFDRFAKKNDRKDESIIVGVPFSQSKKRVRCRAGRMQSELYRWKLLHVRVNQNVEVAGCKIKTKS